MKARCWKCDTELDEEQGENEYPTYCGPCRATLILPCGCGGVFDRSGKGMPECHNCGIRCGYWDDGDLVDPEEMEKVE